MSRARKLTLAFLVCAALAGVCFGIYRWDVQRHVELQALHALHAQREKPIVRFNADGTFDLPQWLEFNVSQAKVECILNEQFKQCDSKHIVLEMPPEMRIYELNNPLLETWAQKGIGCFQISSMSQRFDWHLPGCGCSHGNQPPHTIIDLRLVNIPEAPFVDDSDVVVHIDENTTTSELFSALSPYLTTSDSVLVLGDRLVLNRGSDENNHRNGHLLNVPAPTLAGKFRTLIRTIKGWF